MRRSTSQGYTAPFSSVSCVIISRIDSSACPKSQQPSLLRKFLSHSNHERSPLRLCARRAFQVCILNSPRHPFSLSPAVTGNPSSQKAGRRHTNCALRAGHAGADARRLWKRESGGWKETRKSRLYIRLVLTQSGKEGKQSKRNGRQEARPCSPSPR